jgi:hypothetical protein
MSMKYTIESFHLRFRSDIESWPEDTSRFCKENSGNAGKRIAPCLEKNEGGAKWLT